MPYIKKVTVIAPTGVGSRTPEFAVTANVAIGFTELERELGVSYRVHIALYEIDERMDAYSVQPNWNRMFLQRASRGDNDDFIGFSPAFELRAEESEETIAHEFKVRTQNEPDYYMELRALAICVPETSTAMQWSGTERVLVQIE